MENTNLSLEDIKRRLLLENKTDVSDDDPVLLVGTILNVFIEQLQANDEKSRAALKAIYSEQANNFQDELEIGHKKISNALEKMSVDSLIRLNADHVSSVNKLKTYIGVSTALFFLSACIHLTVFILR